MKATFEKFLFAAVVILITAAGAKTNDSTVRHPADRPAEKETAVPLFVLRAPAASPPSPIVPRALATAPRPVSSDAGRGALASDPSVVAAPFSRRASSLPGIQAAVAAVADLQTGEVYFGKGLRRHWPIASITKLMSGVETVREADQDQSVTVIGGDTHLKAGDTYRVRDLLRVMLTVSSNEAAEAIATRYGRANFIAGMNAIAREWGLTGTNFADPTGLSPANQSTAEDLVTIARRVHEDYREILEVTRAPEVALSEASSGVSRVFRNINLFAGKPGFLGGKTGYTDEAGGNLLTIWSAYGRPVFFLVMGSDDRFGETERLLQWFEESFKASG